MLNKQSGEITQTANAMPSNRVWVVTAPSAYRLGHTCFLGRGATKQEALANAFGPRESWGKLLVKALRNADVFETDEATANELEESR